jgi:iron(III) transport system permease protein
MALHGAVLHARIQRVHQFLSLFVAFRPTADDIAAATAIIGVLIVLGIPLAVMIFTSFRGPDSTLPFDERARTTLANYLALLRDASFLHTIRDTSLFVVSSLTISLGVGIPLAWLTQRTDMPGRRLFYILLFVPYLIPGITRAQVWGLMLGPEQGLFNQVLRLVIPVQSGPLNAYSPAGIIVAQGLSLVPLVTLFVGAALRNLDSSLEEASRASGAGVLTTLRRVTIPLATPAVVGVALILFVFLIDAFEIPLLFGASTMLDVFGMHIWAAMNPTGAIPLYGQIAAMGVTITLVCYGLVFQYNRVIRYSERFATILGKGGNAAPSPLGRLRWPFAALMVIVIVFLVIMPLFGLVWQSLMPFYRTPSLEALAFVSLGAYERVVGDAQFWQALRVTLVLAIASAAIVTLLAATVAWTVARRVRQPKLRAALDLFASSSLGVPQPIVAFSLLMFFIAANQWIPLYGTIPGLILAYCFRMGLAYRTSRAGLLQISQDLEDASAASGGDGITTFRRVLVPLIIPTLVIVFVLSMIGAFNDFTLALFLAKGDAKPIGVHIYGLLNTRPHEAAAIGVLNVVLVLALASLVSIIGSRRRVAN